MGSISVGDRTLHLYKGHFLWRDNRPSPSSFRTMASRSSRRRSRGSRRAASSSFLPIVVLDGQKTGSKSRYENQLDRSSIYDGGEARHLTGGRHYQDRVDTSLSGSDMYGSYTNGGCAAGGGGAGNAMLPVLIAAIAAATFFLYNAILNAGKKRKRRQMDEDGGDKEEDHMVDLLLMGKICFDSLV
jgi:hypothetical protein